MSSTNNRSRRPFEVGLKRKAALNSKADAQAYVQFVRKQIQQAFGPWPEKTPLKPRISGIVDRDVYTIEKVLFESRPEFFITANLYVPKGKKFPLPGVVGSCGHSVNGKAAEAYQSFAQGLARQGYVVLIFDPIGQGERFQHPDEATAESPPSVRACSNILHDGNQQFLIGEFFGSWRAWDGMRALDYLLSRHRGRSEPCRHHGQLRRRHDDDVAMRCRIAGGRWPRRVVP